MDHPVLILYWLSIAILHKTIFVFRAMLHLIFLKNITIQFILKIFLNIKFYTDWKFPLIKLKFRIKYVPSSISKYM